MRFPQTILSLLILTLTGGTAAMADTETTDRARKFIAAQAVFAASPAPPGAGRKGGADHDCDVTRV